MEIFILTNGYPSNESLYQNAFVHRRVLEYVRSGINIKVFIPSRQKQKYIFDGIEVYKDSEGNIVEYFNKNKPKKIIVHFILPEIINILYKLSFKCETLIWIHLYEATNWKRRLFNISDVKFPGYVLKNIYQLRKLKQFIRYANKNTSMYKFIFVSQWVKHAMEKDLKLRVKEFSVIHNLIDNKLFSFKPKKPEDRMKILLIRPFNSKKYANDIAIEFLLKLSRKEYFKDLDIKIYGKGKHFKKLTKRVQQFKNIHLNETFLRQEDIKKQHDENGIFLCPTRQDSQGVSMGEAMSSGLVVLTSNNSAIPEFCEHGKTGLLSKSSSEMVEQYEKIYNNAELFNEISIKASNFISKTCSFKETTDKEIKLLLGDLKK